VPASGGSHGVSLSLTAPTVNLAADVPRPRQTVCAKTVPATTSSHDRPTHAVSAASSLLRTAAHPRQPDNDGAPKRPNPSVALPAEGRTALASPSNSA
jgi:hypothetical protein